LQSSGRHRYLDCADASPASFWQGQAAYEQILGFTPRLLLASFLAYLVGEFANSFILAKLKIISQGRFLWYERLAHARGQDLTHWYLSQSLFGNYS